MYPAHRPSSRIERKASLYDLCRQTGGGELPCAECPRKETPLIRIALQLYQQSPMDAERPELHSQRQKKSLSICPVACR